MWKETNPLHSVDCLLFGDTKFKFKYQVDLFGKKNFRIHDFYTQNINNIYDEENLDLELIMYKFVESPESTVIVNCLNSLILTVGLNKTIKFLENLRSCVFQLICIYQHDFGMNKVPSIETMGTTYLKLDETNCSTVGNNLCYDVMVIHRKHGGGIVKNHVVITQDIKSYEIKSEKQVVFSNATTNSPNIENSLQHQSTFRIEMSAREIEQRYQTPLPYARNNTLSESKIFYVPDCIDDLDEEDPDDDLSF